MNQFSRDNFAKTLYHWYHTTFLQAFHKFSKTSTNQELNDCVLDVLETLNLKDRIMSGTISQLSSQNEKEFFIGTFVHYFNLLQESETFWTPFDIIVLICQDSIQDKSKFTQMADKNQTTVQDILYSTIKRTFRALPSYLREEQLYVFLQLHFPDCSVYKSETLDIKGHADVVLETKNHTFHFWSYVNSANSCKNIIEKFTGTRGKLANVNHVLCPISVFDESECATLYDWKFYNSATLHEIILTINTQHAVDYYQALQIGSLYNNSFYRQIRNVAKSY